MVRNSEAVAKTEAGALAVAWQSAGADAPLLADAVAGDLRQALMCVHGRPLT